VGDGIITAGLSGGARGSEDVSANCRSSSSSKLLVFHNIGSQASLVGELLPEEGGVGGIAIALVLTGLLQRLVSLVSIL